MVRNLEPYNIVEANLTVRLTDRNTIVRGYIDIDLDMLPLKTLPNFKYISHSLSICNKQLTSLKGCPIYVGGDFYCHYNRLTSLEGCPIYVGGDLYCGTNKLTSLDGCATYIGGRLYCKNNKIKLLRPDGVNIIGKFSS